MKIHYLIRKHNCYVSAQKKGTEISPFEGGVRGMMACSIRATLSVLFKTVPLLKYTVFLIIFLCVTQAAFAQQKDTPPAYKLSPAPDVWFNSVDGIRLGIRLRGEVPGTFEDGPHRLDAGLWVGTFLPKYPVSYYVSYTEPISSISGYNSEGSIGLRSSIRTGYHKHAIILKKRWQPGFKETNYRELSVSVRAEDRFDDEYLVYPQLWQKSWLYIAGLHFRVSNGDLLGRYHFDVTSSANLAGSYNQFISTQFELQQLVPISDYFSLRARLFAGIASNNAAPEYLFSHSFKPYVEWDELGTTRAKGTLPTAWVHEGFVQVAGGANLRGYNHQDIQMLNDDLQPVYTTMSALNVELDYPNPLNVALKKIPFAGLLNLRSYLFFDSGTSLGFTGREESRLLSDAGLGFTLSLNIPDYLGKSRGFALRYEVPLWLSDPKTGDSNFSYRNLLGIGAVISF